MERGLNDDGTIAREGALDRVPKAFAPVVAATRAHISQSFSDTRLHSAYLYGSIPRGTAVPGVSDLDVQLALHDEPTKADRATATVIETALDQAFPEISGAGILLSSTRTLLGTGTEDGGFWVACLCTPLLGPDLAEQLPRYRPTSRLAREINGDLGLLLPGWRTRAAAAHTNLKALSRSVSRHLVRTGFTLVMPRWGGWTSDLGASAELFGRYYPDRAGQMRLAADIGRTPTTDPAVLQILIDDLAPWLLGEYTAVHGAKDS
ncbi:nucleotidyltransferase [Actinokineospora sp. NBRC 105648]|uniref:nucleotidyltransferase n=1 Tax=Actinokineospora sp. NBRC 105648 TaxID=3032206 RepID=UPI0024A5A1BC|nr:nucleotidyltransferase [Actinokineospora sp. NBRC 105648]GLZ43439.1 hypothetical protein Acsp05_70630 [Actinokineospora sp. NBRC 105648]